MNRNETSPAALEKADLLLARFFRAETPQAWPGFAYPEEAPRVVAFSKGKPGKLWMSRLALAASVAILFLGYLSFSSMFPGSSRTTRGMIQDTSGHIGSRPRVAPLDITSKTGEPNEGFEGGRRPLPIRLVQPLKP